MSAIERGAVIEYPSVFGFDTYPRPYLIISNDSHPFHGEEYIGLAITTTDHDPALQIDSEAWIRGGLPKRSFVKPWQPTILKDTNVEDAFGLLRAGFVDEATAGLTTPVGGA